MNARKLGSYLIRGDDNMLGIDTALIGTIIIGVPVCIYAVIKDMKKKPIESPYVTKEIEAKDGTKIIVMVDKRDKVEGN